MGLDDRFRFGKYGPRESEPGLTLEAVLDIHPGYVRWQLTNNKDFSITAEATGALEAAEIADRRKPRRAGPDVGDGWDGGAHEDDYHDPFWDVF